MAQCPDNATEWMDIWCWWLGLPVGQYYSCHKCILSVKVDTHPNMMLDVATMYNKKQ